MSDETRNHRSDIGRRVALRREQLGLSREDVADRAGVAPQYLRYLEERPASPSQASLTRVARALDTTVSELSGAEPQPAGQHAAPHGRLIELDTDACYQLVAEHNVGRIALDTASGPAIVPVTYSLVDGAIVFRVKANGSGVSCVREAAETAFEVDHLDELRGVGWSVLVVGRPRQITDPAEVAALAGRTGVRPGEEERDASELWVRLHPERVTGRRVHLE
ncbi:helix-turn-helix domain-containing protein [Streptomyces johnsoniae]|uniref:Pyridoxamine 5'-phosphate oxidase family protein n=1 Tax=Streptomyces johnsoniae TaxID=3075532 RepID=A0ABU2S4M6_9ACTN|nr:pyridoxamine 5'-phosphate oxidase family protein [Streptomyces sp. DSM 41886]MDT0443922.1 pyridoxamine 5'-phosphate oxidase family protein [Streptomyces sp. DSM 41886]